MHPTHESPAQRGGINDCLCPHHSEVNPSFLLLFSFFSDLNVNNNIKKPACSFDAPRETSIRKSR